MVADALSRLPLNGNQETTQKSTYQKGIVSEINDIKNCLKVLYLFFNDPKCQQEEPSIISKYKDGTYHKGSFCGIINTDLKLITGKDNIVI